MACQYKLIALRSFLAHISCLPATITLSTTTNGLVQTYLHVQVLNISCSAPFGPAGGLVGPIARLEGVVVVAAACTAQQFLPRAVNAHLQNGPGLRLSTCGAVQEAAVLIHENVGRLHDVVSFNF
jgi:hypothetical protein